jgi:hypothetical protein
MRPFGSSNRALPFRPTCPGQVSAYTDTAPGMTLTLQPRTLPSAELRFLGTVPETDVLVVTHKRNMRSKFR